MESEVYGKLVSARHSTLYWTLKFVMMFREWHSNNYVRGILHTVLDLEVCHDVPGVALKQLRKGNFIFCSDLNLG